MTSCGDHPQSGLVQDSTQDAAARAGVRVSSGGSGRVLAERRRRQAVIGRAGLSTGAMVLTTQDGPENGIVAVVG